MDWTEQINTVKLVFAAFICWKNTAFLSFTTDKEVPDHPAALSDQYCNVNMYAQAKSAWRLEHMQKQHY